MGIHEIDKIRKRLEAEKMEVQAALEEAEGALEQEENKVLRSQLELTQVRQEIERRIAEKDEEFLSTKKNFTKGIDGMQTALEQEAKAEALRMKKKLEADVSELETALEHANAANAETQKTIKKYHGSIRDAQAKLEGEQRAKEVTRDGLLASEFRRSSKRYLQLFSGHRPWLAAIPGAEVNCLAWAHRPPPRLNRMNGTHRLCSTTSLRYFWAFRKFIPLSILAVSRVFLKWTRTYLLRDLQLLAGLLASVMYRPIFLRCYIKSVSST